MANVIYVESYGDDTNTGTINAPVATIAKAVELASTDRNTVHIGAGVFEVDFVAAMSKSGVTLNFIGKGKETTILVKNSKKNFDGNVNFYKMIMKPVDNFSYPYYTLVDSNDTNEVNYYNCAFVPSDNGQYPTTAFMSTSTSETARPNKVTYNCLFVAPKQNARRIGFLICYNCASTSTSSNFYNPNCTQSTDCQINATINEKYELTNYDNGLYGVYSGEYAWEKKENYFIKYQGRYYTIKEEKYNGSFYDEVTLDEINNNYDNLGFDLSELLTDVTINMETFKPIDKFEEFSIVTNESIKSIVVEGIKSNTEMIIASNDFPTTIYSNIDFFENQAEITGNGEIKMAFSIDEGVTWKTHNGTSFIGLPITIPCKPYNELTEDELMQWDNARDEILATGIGSATLKTLDFNTLTFDKIRFAYVLHVEDVEDTALNKKLIWQFDAKGSMKLMKDSEIDIEVLPTSIKVTPKVDSSLIKLNIVTDDGQNDSSGGDEGGNTTNPTFNFATRQDILGLF